MNNVLIEKKVSKNNNCLEEKMIYKSNTTTKLLYYIPSIFIVIAILILSFISYNNNNTNFFELIIIEIFAIIIFKIVVYNIYCEIEISENFLIIRNIFHVKKIVKINDIIDIKFRLKYIRIKYKPRKTISLLNSIENFSDLLNKISERKKI